MPNKYGVDVAAYQSTSLAADYSGGAKFVIVKATEGLSYFNPKAVAQIRSAHAHKMLVHAYHFATFGNSVSRARAEAKHFIARCHYLNISKKRCLALDWETGDGNYVYGNPAANTKAILAFMAEIKKDGYKPLLYSSAYLLRNNIYTKKVIKKFGTCLWVAAYPASGPIYSANFHGFPSMDGVLIWQFTDNWRGLNVDGNVWLDVQKKALSHKASTPKHAEKHAEKIPLVVRAICKEHPTWYISLRDKDGHATGKFIPPNTNWKVIAEKEIHGIKYYKLGTDKQFVPARFLEIVK